MPLPVSMAIPARLARSIPTIWKAGWVRHGLEPIALRHPLSSVGPIFRKGDMFSSAAFLSMLFFFSFLRAYFLHRQRRGRRLLVPAARRQRCREQPQPSSISLPYIIITHSVGFELSAPRISDLDIVPHIARYAEGIGRSRWIPRTVHAPGVLGVRSTSTYLLTTSASPLSSSLSLLHIYLLLPCQSTCHFFLQKRPAFELLCSLGRYLRTLQSFALFSVPYAVRAISSSLPPQSSPSSQARPPMNPP